MNTTDDRNEEGSTRRARTHWGRRRRPTSRAERHRPHCRAGAREAISSTPASARTAPGTLSCHREALWRSPGHRTDWRAGTRNSQTRRGEPGYCWSLWTRLLAAWPASPPGAPAPLAGLLPCDPRSKGEAGAEAHARFVSPVTAVTAVPPVTKAISEVVTSSLFNEKTKQDRISQAGARRF